MPRPRWDRAITLRGRSSQSGSFMEVVIFQGKRPGDSICPEHPPSPTSKRHNPPYFSRRPNWRLQNLELWRRDAHERRDRRRGHCRSGDAGRMRRADGDREQGRERRQEPRTVSRSTSPGAPPPRNRLPGIAKPSTSTATRRCCVSRPCRCSAASPSGCGAIPTCRSSSPATPMSAAPATIIWRLVRATSVINYLISLGILAQRLATVSYTARGKKRPEIAGSSEETWSQNRRVVAE
jgi:hypothetical protein